MSRPQIPIAATAADVSALALEATLSAIQTLIAAQPAGSAADPLAIALGDSPSVDAFGRLRISDPQTIFDSKLLHDAAPLLWDDSEVSGGSTTTAHSTTAARVRIGVAATTAGKRVRQTFQRFNYQPGKSQLVFMTGVMKATGGGTGITGEIGPHDDEDGVFFRNNAGTVQAVVRSFVSGAAVDTAVSQDSWDDPMDGTGASGVTVDWTKTQIFGFDLEWLGVGRVRFYLVVDGRLILVHEVNHANSGTTVYMSTPNLPLRYSIANDGTGGASTLDHICATVISEGGLQNLGRIRWVSLADVHVNANTAGTIYALVGIRLKTTHLDASVIPESVSVLSETADNCEWLLYWNPTVAGTFTYADVTNSAVQAAYGDTSGNPSTNTITGGTVLAGGYLNTQGGGGGQSGSGSVTSAISNALRLGANLAGTRDTLVLAVRPLGANADVVGGIGYRDVT